MKRRNLLSSGLGFICGAVIAAMIPSHLLLVSQEPTAAGTASGERWACAMMDYIGSRPGSCPVCGMKLELVRADVVTREQQRRIGLETTTVALGPATMVVRAAGSAEYNERYSQTMIARIPGRIVKRHDATFGCCEQVDAGDPVIDLFSAEAYQAQLELANALANNRSDAIEAATARLLRWNLPHVVEDIRAGKPATDVVTLRSPFSGIVLLDNAQMVDRTLMVGSEVTADMPLLKLVDNRRLTLVFHVPENHAHMLREGQPVELSSDDLGELPDVEASIDRVSSEISPEIRTREIRVHLTLPKNVGARRILPGSLLTGRIRVALRPDLTPADPDTRSTWGEFVLVPKTAILSTGVRHVAWRVASRNRDGSLRFEPVAVALGPRLESADGSDRYIIRSGLSAGDEIATQGAFLVDSQAQLAGSPSLLMPDGVRR